MQAFTNTVKGNEILYFEDAEIQGYKGSQDSFAASGTLYVLYFKAYNRFVLQLNDWKYPLLRRLPITLTSDKNDSSSRTFVLPGLGGSSYQLKINNIPNNQALINFETILTHNSFYSVRGEDTSSRKAEHSPDDKLVRKPIANTGLKEIIAGNVKSSIHAVMTKAATFKTGTKNLTSTKKRINLKDIKTKNFRKEARPSFNAKFLHNQEKLTYEFFGRRRLNKNLTEARELSALTKTTGTPVHYIFREDIEESILRNKDLASLGKFAPVEERKGFMQGLKDSFSNITSKATSMTGNLIGGNRDTSNTLKEEKLTQLESTHHSEA